MNNQVMSWIAVAPLVCWIIACLYYRRYRKEPEPPPFCGAIQNIKVVRPKYTNPSRVGTRIDFVLRLWGTGKKKTRIKGIVATISSTVSTGMHIFSRPLLRQNPLHYNYVFHEGVDVQFHVSAYIDDIEPKNFDGDSLVVEIVDTEGREYIFDKVPGDKAVYV